ncbi:ATP-binding protein [Nocardia sp. ET3-3]|uniref:histidine kinase n=2 Tax=Nocardia terrae TaxID=2675851 RepID=A0A7K1V9M1_9NOCA|nr:ATP-binding protein [Nocardia terrae]
MSAGALAITAGGVAVAVFFAPNEFRLPLAIGASVAALSLTAAITMAVYYRERVRWVRQEALGYRAQAEAHVATAMSATQARIAESEARIHGLQEQVNQHSRTARESENRRAAAMAAFAGAAGRMQAMSTSMLAELREMEHRHADPKVLADLLELDHRTAQAGRLADSIAVLSGARSGRRWAKPIAMESILRGAMGRVAGYQRVRLRAITEIAIAGHAAEGIMHALAELLDNACNFSPPTTEVHVYAAEVPAGIVITIEDSGLVMSESALRRAESAVSREHRRADLSSLSGTRLGLAVVGHLARKHDLTVSYRPSAIGGTAVVVVVPRELTTRLERNSGTFNRLTPVGADAARPANPAASSQDSTSDRADTSPAAILPPAAVSGPIPIVDLPPAAPAASLDEIAQHAATSSGLPKRRRGSTLAAVHPDGLAAPATAPPPRPPARPSAMAAFQRAVSGRGVPGGSTTSPLTNLGPAGPGDHATPTGSAGGVVPPGGEPASAAPSPNRPGPDTGSGDDTSLLPSSLLDAVRRGEFRENARAAARYDTGSFPAATPPASVAEDSTGPRSPGFRHDGPHRETYGGTPFPASEAPSELER